MLYGKCEKILKSVNFLCQTAEETTTLDIGVYLHNRIQTEDLLGCLHLLEDDGFIEIISESGPLLHVKLTHKGTTKNTGTPKSNGSCSQALLFRSLFPP